MRAKKKQPQIKKFRRFVLSVFMLALLGLSIGKIGFIYAKKSDFYAQQGNLRSIKKEMIPALRGVIRDRNGEIFALTTVLISLAVDLEHLRIKPDMSSSQRSLAKARIKKFKENISFIAARIDKSEKWLLDKAFPKSKKLKFRYLAKALPPQVTQELKAKKIPALVYERKLKRFYPQGKMAASLIGFSDFADKGKSGLEASFDEHLSGASGAAWVRRDHLGNAIDHVSVDRSAIRGNDLILSIDSRIQEIAYFSLVNAMKKHKAKKVSAVVLDAKNGEILAMANFSSFNPNDTRQRVSVGTRNTATQDLFEPGSTMKPFTVLAALEAGVINKDTSLHIGNGKIKVANATYRDSSRIDSQDISLGTMLRKSSNVGAIKVGLKMSAKQHRDFLYRLGFGQKPDIGLYGSARGVLRPVKKITKVDHASMSFGLGLNASVLQIAQSYLVLANAGKMPAVSIVKKTGEIEFSQVASADNANHVLDLLKSVVSKKGTAPRARIEGFSVAGKTGTSHKFINGKYAKKQYIGLFAGIVPANDPRLVIVTLIDEPKGKSYYGGTTAAPVFSEIGSKTLAYLGIKPDQNENTSSVLAYQEQAQ